MKLKTWNAHGINDGTNYESVIDSASWYGLPDTQAVMANRSGTWPVAATVDRRGRKLYFTVYIRAIASRATLQSQLAEWFDPDDETPKKLICEDAAGGGDRYIYGICEELKEVNFGAGLQYVVGIRVHGDPLWRENTATTASWDITASGQTKVLANGGKADAYPTLQIKPTAAKTGGWAYKRWIPIRWRTNEAAVMYPVDVFDNNLDGAALVTATKLQADGDDLRIVVNGLEVSRWLQDINTATAQCWISLDFQAKQEGTLAVAIAGAGAITTITVNEDISGFPTSGILVVASEAFVYTGVDLGTKQFTGVTRSTKGTSAAAASIGDAIWWCQYEIFAIYGNAAATAPVYTNTGKPIFNLASTNTSWDYDSFNVDGETRAGAWAAVMNGAQQTRNNQGTNSSATWEELGIACMRNNTKSGYIYIMNPCYITNANFQSGEYLVYTGSQTYFDPSISEYHPGSYVGWDVENGLGISPTLDAYTAWTKNQAISGNATGVRLWHSSYQPDPWVMANHYIEASDVTLTLNSSYTPAVAIGAEQSTYDLACRITNNTTGLAIDVAFQMALNQEIEIDTDGKTVTYLADGSNQFQALTLVGAARRDWLKLQTGNNTLQFDDTGTDTVTIDFDWEERHYH